LQSSDLFDIVSKLHNLGHDWFYLVDFGELVRLEQQIVTLFDGSDDLRHSQLGRHELLQPLLCLIYA